MSCTEKLRRKLSLCESILSDLHYSSADLRKRYKEKGLCSSDEESDDETPDAGTEIDYEVCDDDSDCPDQKEGPEVKRNRVE